MSKVAPRAITPRKSQPQASARQKRKVLKWPRMIQEAAGSPGMSQTAIASQIRALREAPFQLRPKWRMNQSSATNRSRGRVHASHLKERWLGVKKGVDPEAVPDSADAR